MTIEELIPFIRRQAKSLKDNLWEDLLGVGLLKACQLLHRNGYTDRGYILKATRNAMLNYLKHESYEPKPLNPATGERGNEIRLERPYIEKGFKAVEIKLFVDSLKPRLRNALIKVMTGEALSPAERKALERFRKSDKPKDLL